MEFSVPLTLIVMLVAYVIVRFVQLLKESARLSHGVMNKNILIQIDHYRNGNFPDRNAHDLEIFYLFYLIQLSLETTSKPDTKISNFKQQIELLFKYGLNVESDILIEKLKEFAQQAVYQYNSEDVVKITWLTEHAFEINKKRVLAQWAKRKQISSRKLISNLLDTLSQLLIAHSKAIDLKIVDTIKKVDDTIHESDQFFANCSDTSLPISEIRQLLDEIRKLVRENHVSSPESQQKFRYYSKKLLTMSTQLKRSRP